MKYALTLSLSVILSLTLFCQSDNAPEISPLLNKNKSGLNIGGYGDIEYVQPLDDEIYNIGELDIHRLVLLFAYQYSDKLRLITEIEFEHVQEVFIEQAFLDYRINKSITWRSGLVLIPMGIINERHESNTFNGVLRPLVDKYLVPTTWREIGTGFQGNYIPGSFRYQAYLVNGFNGYDGDPSLNGSNGLRSGRQKAAESYISRPNISAKIEYYGIPYVNLGLALYHGDSQSTAFQGISKSDAEANSFADSTVVKINMLGLDARYNRNGIQSKAQFIYTMIDGSEEYNISTGSDLGSSMLGYYAEIGYDVFHTNEKFESALIPFLRYDRYDTQASVASSEIMNEIYNRNAITGGITWKPINSVAFKADLQSFGNASTTDRTLNGNLGIGFAF